MDFFKKIGDQIGDQIGQLKIAGEGSGPCASKSEYQSSHRFKSFAPVSSGDAKWYVDGASYFWALSAAIEEARESIYILDWWLSPELYLRRPPSGKNHYRVDNLLRAAAERGVKVKIIVYKEVEAALTLNSSHTRTTLEALHPNISVFRHPDHTPVGYDLKKKVGKTFQNLKSFQIAKASGNALTALYGTSDGIVLFWAHHEKLCLIDRKIVFMGGLDACFGRWDSCSHPIADYYPGNEDAVTFPGQDYNNARIRDFENVAQWEQNKLDRSKSCRMGWSDVALSLSGGIATSLMAHFVDRWNWIHHEKYGAKNGDKYPMLDVDGLETREKAKAPRDASFGRTPEGPRMASKDGESSMGLGLDIQLTRSCSQWSGGHDTERSIVNAYIDVISNAEHFVYVENQFFITATGDKQRPVRNKIGAAMVERIVRAHREGTDFRIIVIMPAVPGFAGDLRTEDALGTRAIMEFQYNSISRGGNSIMEALRARGVRDVGRYIGFYNLRNYDRIISGSADGRDGKRAMASVAACYMQDGPDLSSIPWGGKDEDEMGAFVSEQLYVHSKLLVADDRVVICGSANVNDRSQVGDHDSEIAAVIHDREADMVDGSMKGRPYRVGKFASSLRRYIFRKHLGLIPHQRVDAADRNWTPVHHGSNEYDWGSSADGLVADPLSEGFLKLWEDTARTNTEVFSKAFHNVPNDEVRNWEDYDTFFRKRFILPGQAKKGPDGEEESTEGKVLYGHVVPDEFPGGASELKEQLGRVRGSLVEMPLKFLVDVPDLAEDGLSLNPLTSELYT